MPERKLPPLQIECFHGLSPCLGTSFISSSGGVQTKPILRAAGFILPVWTQSMLSYYSSWKKGGGKGGRKEKSGLNQINPNPHTLPQTITQSYNLKVVEWFNHKYPGSLVIGLLVCTAEMEWLGPLVNKRKERSITNGVPLWSKVVKAAFR